MKTSELTGAALDWAVAKCEEQTVRFDPMGFKTAKKPGGYWIMEPDHGQAIRGCDKHIGTDYSPSTNWTQGGPIIERELIEFRRYGGEWRADLVGQRYGIEEVECAEYGPTMLIAGLRCYVAFKLGDEVDVPEQLL